MPGGMHAWGVCAQGAWMLEACMPGGVCLGGVCPGSMDAGGMHAQGVHAQAQVSSPHGQTDTCENITFANFVCRW